VDKSIRAQILESDQYLTDQARMTFALNVATLALAQVAWCHNLDANATGGEGSPPNYMKKEKYKEVSPSEEFEAQIGLVEEYAHTVYGLDRDIWFHKVLSDLFPFEVVMYLMKPAFRDHLYHVLQVYLLGEFLLESRMEVPATPQNQAPDRALWNILLKNSNDLEKRGWLGRNWVFAALFHDIGFIYDAVRQVMNQNISPRSPDLARLFTELRESYRKAETNMMQKEDGLKHVIKAWLGTDADKVSTLDHGLFSCAEGIALYEALFNEPDLEKMDLKDAFKAILKHNLKVKIQCEDEPLSFLLFLCDHLQEWDRPRVNPGEIAKKVVFNLYQVNEEMSRGEPSLLYFRVNGCTKVEQNAENLPRLYLLFKEKSWRFFLHFRDAKMSYIEPVCYWGKTTLDANNLDFPHDFEYNFELFAFHPYSHFLQTSQRYRTEMDMFQDAIDQEDIGAGVFRWIRHLRNRHADLVKKKPSEMMNFDPFLPNKVFDFMKMLGANDSYPIAYVNFPEKEGEGYYLKLNSLKRVENEIPVKWPEEIYRLMTMKMASSGARR